MQILKFNVNKKSGNSYSKKENNTSNKIIKIVSIILIIGFIILLICTIKAIFFYIINSIENNKVSDTIEVTQNNYTDFLKDCHENMNKFVGKNVHIVGFVYKMDDFNPNEFVVARFMESPYNDEYVVVGILCEMSGNCDYKENTWVDVYGTIKIGYYHGDIPIIEVKNISETKVEENPIVSIPQDS